MLLVIMNMISSCEQIWKNAHCLGKFMTREMSFSIIYEVRVK